ncbi:MAG: GNAT family N-acetyltransferase [Devosia sp.]
MLTIRHACLDDAEAMSALRIASITKLCAPDHDNDPDVIADWIGNKDAQAFRGLMARDDTVLLVAERGGRVVGLGGTAGARITLNYVDPDFRFQGVSTAMLEALERAVAAAGFASASLDSSATALPFYRARGWQEAGDGTKSDGYPMRKRL